MNENDDSIKYGECRCCSNVGQHRDLMLEYEWNGTREVYFNTFLECFNLFLSTNSKKGNLICSSCILRLRDASSFKKMVLEAERNLLSYDVNQENSIVQLQNKKPDLQDEHLVEIKNEKTDVNSECSEFDQNGANSDTDGSLELEENIEERDYQCETCSYRCFTKNELKVHMIKHNGERIFECTVCKKSYARKKTLREHMRIHNNDRRYACKSCGQAFVQNCSLKGHVKTHHPELLAP
ncbi:unnamed protein product [Euphydryas editha]|uniref:Uncharacterized protein n=1 Tax=Euphydryas editha TaxID=104508 RepID=A0AAU9VEX1_EUPED|nr:unnamed protein product [Euphydryas editha]